MRHYPTPPWPLAEREDAIAEFREVARRGREFALEAARAVQRVKLTGAHWKTGAASIPEFAERNGMSAWEGRTYENLARAIEKWPEIEALVLEGAMTVAAAGILGDVSRMPESFFKPDDRWIEWACKEDVRLFRRRFEKRRDEHRAGKPVHTITAHVTPEGLADLGRARVLISREARRVVSLGQTLEVLALEWTRNHDPLLVKPGLRRVPDTGLLPGSRYVPSEVDRTIRVRDDDRCIVPFCTHEFRVEKAHFVPHCEEGSREAKNMAIMCDFHNWLELQGDIGLRGDADDPIVVDRNGEPLGERLRPELGCDGRPSPKPGARKATPEEELAAFLGEPLRPSAPKEPAQPADPCAGEVEPPPPVPPVLLAQPSDDWIDDDFDPTWLASMSDPDAKPPEPPEPEVDGDSEAEGEPESEPGGSQPEDDGEPRAPP